MLDFKISVCYAYCHNKPCTTAQYFPKFEPRHVISPCFDTPPPPIPHDLRHWSTRVYPNVLGVTVLFIAIFPYMYACS